MHDTPEERLSRMVTPWTLLFEAHQGAAEETRAARDQLLRRYSVPVRRYLLGAVRGDTDLGDELFQEFALRFVRGDYKTADRQRGRFRDYLKTCLANLVSTYHRRRQRDPLILTEAPERAAEDTAPALEAEEEFLAAWRNALVGAALKRLEQQDAETGQALYWVLRLRMDHPEMRSAAMAEHLGAQLGKPLTAVWVRNRLHFARAKFAELLLDEVRQSLEAPTAEQLADELSVLGLLDPCRSALEQRGKE
jgi:RNA polymerase sigma-70 factor (ECF subfamily)